MNRTPVRSLLISSVALLPLLAATAHADSTSEEVAVPPAESGFVLYRPIAEALIQDETIDEIEPEVVIEVEPVPEALPRAYTASLQEATRDRSTRTLDWRSPQVELRFDLSHSDITDALSVTLAADPLSGVDATIPLVMQFNGGNPVEIETRGLATNTAIDLDPSRVRDTGNVLRLSYATSCKAPVGGYQLNLDSSRLDVTARHRGDQPQLRDVERQFSSLTFAPTTVGLISSGDIATKGQALAAQGVGLRTDKIPAFTTVPREADFDIVMLTRADLVSFTTDDEILLSAGPLIALSPTHPNRLFLTGDTPDEVLQSVSAFATASLPDSRLSMTTPDVVFAQSPLDVDRRLVEGTANLDVLTVQTGTQRDYVFDVTDPAASEGHLVLHLNRDAQTQAGTRLKATLNGSSLGEAIVRGRRKTVSYPIQNGLLLGTGNRLELTTQDANDRPRCGASVPFIAIAEGSELQLNAEIPTPVSDLSRFAADGSLFGQDAGAQTVMILPEDTDNFTSSLAIVAKLARASGRGWVDADFARGHTDLADRHVLIIEPYSEIEREFRIDAPLILQSAWRGHAQGETLGANRSEFIEKFASLDGEATVRQAARSIQSELTHSGGVAAIYPGDDGRLIGVISNTADSNFAAAIAPLATDLHWNELKGGVTQWDDNDVIMSLDALPMPQAAPIQQSVEVAPSLVARGWALASSIPAIELPKPEVGALSHWIDTHWTSFSTDRQPRILEVEPYSETVLSNREPVMNTDSSAQTDALQRPSIALPQHISPAMVTPVATGVQGRVEQFGNKAADLRTGLWRHLDIPEQDMKSARLGQAQIIPAALALIVLFLMLLVGLTFASTPADDRLRR